MERPQVKDESTGEMLKDVGDKVVDWIWRLCWPLRVLLWMKIGDLL